MLSLSCTADFHFFFKLNFRHDVYINCTPSFLDTEISFGFVCVKQKCTANSWLPGSATSKLSENRVFLGRNLKI